MTILLYGATGYTAKLIAALAHTKGVPLVLAGRNAAKIEAEANPQGYPVRPASLDQPKALADMLKGVRVVLNAAGPFSKTSRLMVDACIANGVHYLDITGEISVFEANARRDHEARAAGVMVMSGVGFDVVPSDCLAAHTARRLPDAVRLALAIDLGDEFSRGTMKTMVESLGKPPKIRRGGQIVDFAGFPKTVRFDVGKGTRSFIPVGWGDVATAFHSTKIADITTYFPARITMRAATYGGYFLGDLLQRAALQKFLSRQVERLPEGPDEAARRTHRSYLLAVAENAKGLQVASRLETPESYEFTTHTALEAACRTASGQAKPGYQTPSSAFGADFVLSFPGVNRVDL